MFVSNGSDIGSRFEDARREILAGCGANESLVARLSEQRQYRSETGVSEYVGMRGGLDDVERTARYLQLAHGGTRLEDPAPAAAAVFEAAGDEPLAEAARFWRDLQGVTRLVGEDGFDVAEAGPRVRSLVAKACGQDDFDGLAATVAGTASRAAARIEEIVSQP